MPVFWLVKYFPSTIILHAWQILSHLKHPGFFPTSPCHNPLQIFGVSVCYLYLIAQIFCFFGFHQTFLCLSEPKMQKFIWLYYHFFFSSVSINQLLSIWFVCPLELFLNLTFRIIPIQEYPSVFPYGDMPPLGHCIFQLSSGHVHKSTPPYTE